jgi:hypothetical protein
LSFKVRGNECMVRHRNYHQALEHYTKGLQVDPTMVELLTNRRCGQLGNAERCRVFFLMCFLGVAQGGSSISREKASYWDSRNCCILLTCFWYFPHGVPGSGYCTSGSNSFAHVWVPHTSYPACSLALYKAGHVVSALADANAALCLRPSSGRVCGQTGT